ncbi:MAG TPA: hypothetical protein VFZ65_22285 [Planctomycetota bacterium]|nr:hypothetical protein [Planctomycetota bacterium]
MRAMASRLAVILLFSSTAPGQRSLWIVDPSGGSGSHYTSLQVAADAAQVLPGDVLQLYPGTHAALTTSKPLVLIGDSSCLLPSVSVANLPPGTEFVIAGCTAIPPVPAPGGAWGMWLTLSNCQGRVVVADVAYYSGGVFPQLILVRLITATDCPDLELANVIATGGGVSLLRCRATLLHCAFRPALGNRPLIGIDALVSDQSHLEVVDTPLRGSPGSVLQGGRGATILGGSACFRATGSGLGSLQGGSGPPPTTALQIQAADVRVSPSVTVVGAVQNTGGTYTVADLPALATLYAANQISTSLFAPAGTPAVLAIGFALPPTPWGTFGTLRLDPGLALSAVAGVVATGNPLASSKPVPPGIQFFGTQFAAQGLALVGGQTVLSNGATFLIR